MLGRIPSAVGYQPTLATDMGTMQERITTTKKGSITSVQVNHKLTENTFLLTQSIVIILCCLICEVASLQLFVTKNTSL